MACYICMADAEDATADLLSDLCACTDRAVHAACLVRWIEQSGRARCGACDRELRGVTVTRRVTAKARAAYVAWLFVFLGGIAVPAYFTTFLVENALRSESAGGIAACVFLLLYECGFCVGLLCAWAKAPPSPVSKVHVDLDALGSRVASPP